jgi:hypothetical protein
MIYDAELFLSYILDDGMSVERAEEYARDLVAEKAWELGKECEWVDLWGRRAKKGRSHSDEPA